MTLEGKLKAKSFTQMESDNFHVPTMYLHKPALFLEDALSICQEAIKEAKIEGLGMFLKELNPYQMVGELSGARAQRDADLMMKVQIAIKELKEKL